MLALAAYRSAHLCPLCGMDKDVCQDPTAENRLTVPDPIRCHVTTAIRRAQVERRAKYGATATHEDALLWTAALRS